MSVSIARSCGCLGDYVRKPSPGTIQHACQRSQEGTITRPARSLDENVSNSYRRNRDVIDCRRRANFDLYTENGCGGLLRDRRSTNRRDFFEWKTV